MTDVLGVCLPGATAVRRAARGRRRASRSPSASRTSSPASRCRRGRRRGCRVAPREAQRAGPGAVAGPGHRAARRLAAAQVARPRPRGGPTRCWRWVRPASRTPTSAVVAHYEALGQRPIAAVLPDSAEDALFRDARLGAGEPRRRHRLRARRRRRRRAAPSPASRCPASTWRWSATTGWSPRRPRRRRPGARVSGVAAYADDWVGFRTIEVDPAERGRGLALLVMAELLEWGAERGATTAYLQVLGDNTRALRCTTGWGSPCTTATGTWPRPVKGFSRPGLRP